MEWQLRIYRIKGEELEQWVDEWTRHVARLRRAHGFTVVGPWVDGATFVWLLGYAGEDGFAAADARYYDSPERRALAPDPARHIEAQQHHMLGDLRA